MAEVPKVVSLRGGEIPLPGVPVDAVVSELERLLEMARAGEVIGIRIACLHADDMTTSTAQGALNRQLVGMVAMLFQDVCDEHRRQCE